MPGGVERTDVFRAFEERWDNGRKRIVENVERTVTEKALSIST